MNTLAIDAEAHISFVEALALPFNQQGEVKTHIDELRKCLRKYENIAQLAASQSSVIKNLKNNQPVSLAIDAENHIESIVKVHRLSAGGVNFNPQAGVMIHVAALRECLKRYENISKEASIQIPEIKSLLENNQEVSLAAFAASKRPT